MLALLTSLALVAASPPHKTVVDLFLEAPTSIVKGSAAERPKMITIADVKNGYVEATYASDGAGDTRYVFVLFNSTQGAMVGVDIASGDTREVSFYLPSAGWKDVTKEVFPVTLREIAAAYRAKGLGEIDPASGNATPIWEVELPRQGTSIRIRAIGDELSHEAQGTVLMTLSFDRTRFSIDGPPTKNPPKR